MKRRIYILLCLALVMLLIQGCGKETKHKEVKKEKKVEKVEKQIIIPTGNTLETRIDTPENYTREQVEEKSLGAFLRNYEMKDDGSQVKLYDGTYKKNQDASSNQINGGISHGKSMRISEVCWYILPGHRGG